MYSMRPSQNGFVVPVPPTALQRNCKQPQTRHLSAGFVDQNREYPFAKVLNKWYSRSEQSATAVVYLQGRCVRTKGFEAELAQQKYFSLIILATDVLANPGETVMAV